MYRGNNSMKYSWLSVLFLVALPVGAMEFPLCLYGVDKPADLKTIKKAGFSCIQTYMQDPQQLDKLAQAAKKYGLKTVFSPNKTWDSEYEQKAHAWPMLAWYLVDEPDVNRWSRERVIEAHQKAKKAWPEHNTALVIGQGRTRIPFYDIPDAMMMDWYPVPHLPLTSFGDNVRYTKEGMAKTHHESRPMWGVVQIFDWKEFKQYRPDNDRIGRFPTAKEIRFMSYDGIANGATGLFYFIFTRKGVALPTAAPEYWERVRQSVREIARFVPYIEKGTPADNPVKMTSPFVMKTWQYKGKLYSLFLNTSDQAQSVPAELLSKDYKPLYGTKKKSLMDGYDVWLLKKNK